MYALIMVDSLVADNSRVKLLTQDVQHPTITRRDYATVSLDMP